MVRYRQHSDNELGGIQKNIIKQVIKAFQINRDEYYKLETIRYNLVLNRMLNISDSFNTSENFFLLEQKIKHLQTRSSMNKNRLFRIPAVLKELITLRYYQYARNSGSIALDLFFK